MVNPLPSNTLPQFDLIAHLFESAYSRADNLAATQSPEQFDSARHQLAHQLRIMARCVENVPGARTSELHATYSYLQTVLLTGAFMERVALAAECRALIERIERGGNNLKRSA